MSDRMSLIPFDKLIKWALAENVKEHSIFGVSQNKFFKKINHQNLHLFGESLENPLGPAAGPHTQLAQNIIAAYLAGSRFFELKTVQILDGEDLSVSKPCILVNDEGYNVEWSTELRVPDAFQEYVKAWFALNLLSKELSLGSNKGFIFNMSVGYDLAGIKSPKIDTFIDGLKDASQTPIWEECQDYILNNLSLFKSIDSEFVTGISPKICTSITISTLHGCPPAEIERIASYLLDEKKLHTYVKCNPTLLGYEFARDTLNQMGYDYLVFDEHHFQDDLQFSDAIPMIKRLQAFAKERNLTFGVKLSNTFPVKINHQQLPGTEMYMSGRSLYPLTINLAYKLAKEFNGDLQISYSGGADFFNIAKIYQTGIWPLTLATTILKPGGYLRFKQMADLLERESELPEYAGVDVEKLKLLAESAVSDPHHLKERREVESRKLADNLPLTDCFIAPCTKGCPIGQDVPEYTRLVGEEKYLEALEVIVAKNPLPLITGLLCNHRCTTKCTRIDYDQAVEIRATKLVAVQKGFSALLQKIEKPTLTSAIKVAVIGAGPAGLAGGYFLARNGIAVTIYDRKDKIGGIIEHIAPDFRISKAAINQDLELIKKSGVQFRLGVDEKFSVTALKNEGFQYIFIATGAWKPGRLKLDSCDQEITNVLEFLEEYNKAPATLKIGRNVAVIGGGNSAMDAARSAKRVAGVDNVYLVYRRTKKYMPAAREELQLALAEGVELKELLTPVSFQQGVLRCQQMELGAADASGRRSPVAIAGAFVELKVDRMIAAVGEQVETEFLTQNGIELEATGRIKVNPDTNETNIPNVFIGGDALRGPATIVEGIADGAKFAQIVMARENSAVLDFEKLAGFNQAKQLTEIKSKKGVLQNIGNPGEETKRCLECNYVCNICVEVCPNRANIAVGVNTENLKCRNQVIHIDGMCNECGNCETFCPYDSAPYQDKLTLFWNEADFAASKNAGFLLIDETSNRFKVRWGGRILDLTFDSSGKWDGIIPHELTDIIWAVYQDYKYLFG
jgi:putative selenate reductase